MWTSIRSHTGRALPGLAVLLTGAIVVAAIVFAVQRISPDQTHAFQSYQLEVSPSTPWHRGQSLSLLWVPTAASSTPNAPPNSVTCQFSLYGPYSTRAGASVDQSPEEEGAPLAASAPALALSTDLAALPPTALTYTLPATVAPGYYVAVGSTDEGGNQWVVEVVA